MKILKYIAVLLIALFGAMFSVAIIRAGRYGQGIALAGVCLVLIYAILNFKAINEQSKIAQAERKKAKEREQRVQKAMSIKVGIRQPSIKKSIKARTTAKWKREIKRTLIPGYGKKGMGWLRDPKRAMYNKVYKKTTKSIWDIFK